MALANPETLSEARNGKQWMSVDGEEEEVCPGKKSGRKTPLLQVRDERDFSMLCACLENGEGPLLRVAIMPNELTLLFSCLTSHTWMDLRKHL